MMNWFWRRPAAAPQPDWPSASAPHAARARLLQSLTAEQKLDLLYHSSFCVTSLQSGRVYRIRAHSHVGNITCVSTGKRYCAHLKNSSRYPADDHILAQALMLRYAEREFLRIACRA